MGGLAPFIRSALYGTAAVVQRSFDADATRQVLAQDDVTGVSLVPTMLTRMLDAGGTTGLAPRGAPRRRAGPRDARRALSERDVPVHPPTG